MRKLSFLLLTVLCYISCGESSIELAPTDLMSHGVPLTIMAPPEAEIKSGDMGIGKEVTIIKEGTPYNIQILAFDATTIDLNELISDEKANVETNSVFKEMVEEVDGGFIYRTEIDSIENYDFRYIKLQGNKQFTFQRGYLGNFTLEDVKMMYDAVKGE